MKKIVVLSILMLSLGGCVKDREYTVTIYNPEQFTIEVGSTYFVGGSISANSTEVFNGVWEKGQSEEVNIMTTYDPDEDGSQFQFASTVFFNVGEGGAFYHEIGSGTVTRQ